MATEITVPQLGESVTEGTIAEWLKQPGDAVAVDEPIVSLETDKVAVEVPSPVAGVIEVLRADVGDTVEVGAVLATVAEGGAPAAMSGVMIHPLDGKYGQFTEEDVRQALRPESRYMPISRMLCAEQTANLGGGAVWQLEKLDSVAQVAKNSGLSTHLDGARLLNACVKTGISAAHYSREYDSCWIDFTKGLGAPMGAVLAGSAEFIQAAWRVKQRIGGAMRQSGVIASYCLYALENNVERLAEDHALASRISESLQDFSGIANLLPVETNIIIADLAADAPSAEQLVSKLREESIHIGAFGDKRIRIVTHLDVNAQAADNLITALSNYLE